MTSFGFEQPGHVRSLRPPARIGLEREDSIKDYQKVNLQSNGTSKFHTMPLLSNNISGEPKQETSEDNLHTLAVHSAGHPSECITTRCLELMTLVIKLGIASESISNAESSGAPLSNDNPVTVKLAALQKQLTNLQQQMDDHRVDGVEPPLPAYDEYYAPEDQPVIWRPRALPLRQMDKRLVYWQPMKKAVYWQPLKKSVNIEKEEGEFL
ncbi:unnamed protein product [Enterobius vermicularis]|uniref:WW domain-containing protein n=1 Tax=Enterobius vermicularis TaxID=51028 RepID=A0A0N4VEH2_ENTVE|nr:unnamed protein product [Enterobius vermicularis]